MDSAEFIHRLHFAFTVTYHYLFPQITMGLAPLIVALKTLALWKKDQRYDDAARFWAKIFGIAFVFGVVTGIPMEFQFGTNWSRFSKYAGGVIGQTLAMEGTFAFFLESAFLGLFLYGEKRMSKIAHWWAAMAVFVGSWLSGYFIVATDAWMQNPVAYARTADGSVTLTSFWGLVLNPWAIWQYAHNMAGAGVTGSFIMMGLGAFYLLSRQHVEQARIFLKVGVIAALIFVLLLVGPTGDGQGRNLAQHQPVTLAAMEALFESRQGAPLVIIGQPDVEHGRIDNPIIVPRVLSYLAYRDWGANMQGLDAFPRSEWPDNIPLLYFTYHIMVGLGTIFMAVVVIAAMTALAQAALRGALDAMDSAAQFSAAVHSQHGGLDHGGNRPPAVSRLRVDAHCQRLFQIGFRGQRMVHAARFSRNVYHPFHPLPVPHSPRARARTRDRAGFGHGEWRRQNATTGVK